MHEQGIGWQVLPAPHWVSSVQSPGSMRHAPQPVGVPGAAQLVPLFTQSLCWWQQKGEAQSSRGHVSGVALTRRQPW